MLCVAKNICNDRDIKKNFINKKIILYGAGKYGSLFTVRFPNIQVNLIVDKKRKMER